MFDAWCLTLRLPSLVAPHDQTLWSTFGGLRPCRDYEMHWQQRPARGPGGWDRLMILAAEHCSESEGGQQKFTRTKVPETRHKACVFMHRSTSSAIAAWVAAR
eukprot:309728-Rhodomonas_salina.1